MVTKFDDNFLMHEIENIQHQMHIATVLPIESTKSFLNRFKDTVYPDGDIRQTGVFYQNEYLNSLAIEFMDDVTLPRVVYERVEIYKNKVLQKSKEIDWELMLGTVNIQTFESLVKKHGKKMPDDIYWKFISAAYTGATLSHKSADKVLKYILSDRPDRHFLMSEDERKDLENLPDKITIYRGCSKKEIKSGKFRFSWSTDRKVAEYFAFEYFNLANGEVYGEKDLSKFDIVERTISKKDVIAYFSHREEFEIIYIADK